MTEYAVPQVVATGCTDALVSFRIPLPEGAREITSIQKTVLIDRAGPTLGSVLLQGRLRALYTVALHTHGPPPPPLGAPLPPGGPPLSWQGPLQAVWADAPFTVAIPIPGAEPDLELALTAAHVTDQQLHLLPRPDGSLRALDDQSLLHLAVRLSRSALLHSQPPREPAREPPGPAHAPTPATGRRQAAFTRFTSRPT
ncbi:MAG: hypothetical protein ACOY93_06075 [Bacillota bacterium]